MALDFALIKEIVENIIGDDDPTTSQDIERFLNSSGREICNAHTWEWLEKRGNVVTKAPYTTGTVSVSQHNTAVTGVGTTWSTGGHDGSNFKGYKFGSGYSDPPYLVTAVGSDTAITLADKYRETALSGATYVLYDDTVEMPSDCKEVIEIRLLEAGREVLMEQRSLRALRRGGITKTTGRPWAYARTNPDAQGPLRILLNMIPDAVYNLDALYRRKYTDGNMSYFPDHLLDLVLERTLYLAHLRDSIQKSNVHKANYDRMLPEHIANERTGPTTYTWGLRRTQQTTYGGISWRGRDLEI